MSLFLFFVSVCARWLSRTFPFGSSLVVLLLLNMIVSSSDERVYDNVGLLFVSLSCAFLEDFGHCGVLMNRRDDIRKI